MQEQTLPISLESDDFDKELLAAPETLRELVENYKRRKLNVNKLHKNWIQRKILKRKCLFSIV